MKKAKNYLYDRKVDYKMDGSILVVTGSLNFVEFTELMQFLKVSKYFYSIHEGRFQIFKLN